MKLGAEKFVDFMESKDLINDVKAATGGLGPQAAIIAAGDVRNSFISLRPNADSSQIFSRGRLTRLSCTLSQQVS